MLHANAPMAISVVSVIRQACRRGVGNRFLDIAADCSVNRERGTSTRQMNNARGRVTKGIATSHPGVAAWSAPAPLTSSYGCNVRLSTGGVGPVSELYHTSLAVASSSIVMMNV